MHAPGEARPLQGWAVAAGRKGAEGGLAGGGEWKEWGASIPGKSVGGSEGTQGHI